MHKTNNPAVAVACDAVGENCELLPTKRSVKGLIRTPRHPADFGIPEKYWVAAQDYAQLATEFEPQIQARVDALIAAAEIAGDIRARSK